MSAALQQQFQLEILALQHGKEAGNGDSQHDQPGQ
jgi:hypothetical protein